MTAVMLALSLEKSFFENIFVNGHDGILLSDEAGEIHAANPAACAILKRTEAGLIGLKRQGLVEQESALVQSPGENEATAGWTEGVLSFHCGDGSRQSCDSSVLPFKMPDGGNGAMILFRKVVATGTHDEGVSRQGKFIEVVREISDYLRVETNEQKIFQYACDAITRIEGVGGVWVGLKKPGMVAEPVAGAGVAGNIAEIRDETIKWDEAASRLRPVSEAIREGRAVYLADIAPADDGISPWHRTMQRLGVGSVVAAPIGMQDKTYGALVIYGKAPHAFDFKVVDLVKEIGADIGVAIDSLRLGISLADTLRNFDGVLDGTLEAISKIIEGRDPFSVGHERRVGDLAKEIGREMGLTQLQVDGLRVMGLIHDIGKISIPAGILTKLGPFTDADYELVKRHPEHGYRILQNIKFPWPVAETVLQHHERLNGSGYPSGLRGDEILLEAKILGVAEVVVAMCEANAYRRKPPGLEAALDEIRRNRGTLYEPAVVDACLKVLA